MHPSARPAVYTEGAENFMTALACTELESGLPASQIGPGLPASSSAADSGYVSPSVINDALDPAQRPPRPPGWPPMSADSPFLRPSNGGNTGWVTTTSNAITRATASGGIAADVTLEAGTWRSAFYCRRTPLATGCDPRCYSRR
jgi:hypothetical protein